MDLGGPTLPPARRGARRGAGVGGLGVTLLLVALAALPRLVVIGRVLADGWVPVSDQALEVVRMHDVGTARTPLLGVYSRLGFHHPGPLLFWVGAPGVRLGGPVGVLVAFGLLGIVWTTLTVLAAVRLGGRSLAIAITFGLVCIEASGGTRVLIDIWNPWLALPALVCFLVTSAAFAETGTRWAGVAAVVAGSFAVQAHLGTTPVVLAWTVAMILWRRRVRPPAERRRRSFRVGSVVLLLVLWSGPLLSELTAPTSNLRALLHFARYGATPPADRSMGLGVAAHELGWRGPWLGARESLVLSMVTAPTSRLLIFPALLLAVAVLARRRAPVVTRLAAAVLLIHVVATTSIARTSGGYLAYVFRWSWAVAMLEFCTVVWGLWQVAAPAPASTPAAERATAGAGPAAPAEHVPASATRTGIGLAAIAATVVVLVPLLRANGHADVTSGVAFGRTSQVVLDRMRGRWPEGRYRIGWSPSNAFDSVPVGVATARILDGDDVLLCPAQELAVGARRVSTDPRIPTVFIVGSRSGWRGVPGAEVLARYDPRPPEVRRRAASLDRNLRRDLGVAPDDVMLGDVVRRRAAQDPELEERWRAILQRSEPTEAYTVYLVPTAVC